MILISAFYVIEPNFYFTKRLSNLDLLDSVTIDLLSETSVWSYHRASETEDDIFEIKLLFLMYLKSEYLSDRLYEKVFDEHLIKCETFDKWWTIKRYFEEESFSDIENRINPRVASCVAKTGRRRVDLWIDKMQNKLV